MCFPPHRGGVTALSRNPPRRYHEFVLAALLLLTVQDTVHIGRLDDRKPLYKGLLDRYAEARAAADTRPEEAVRLLDGILAQVADGPVECRIRLERFANDFEDPQDFFPLQLRGRTRLALAEREAADRRALLRAALADLEASTARKLPSSEPLRREALRRLWEHVRPGLAFDADPLDPEALVLFRRAPDEAWLRGQIAAAKAALAAPVGRPEDRHPLARRVLAWTAAVGAEELRVPAEAALSRRSRFRLQIAVHPYAELARVTRDGRELSLDVRHTPLVLDLEAGDFEAELRHPRWGSRAFRFGGADVADGRTYALSGDMETGRLALNEVLSK